MKTLGRIISIETVRDDYDGYQVTTNQHTFMVLIKSEQYCCEDWGYLSSNDDLEYFIGAMLREVKLTDTALNQKVLENDRLQFLDSGGVQFVDFVTSKGTFQLAVYNGHNGYYGHSILVTKDNSIIHRDTL